MPFALLTEQQCVEHVVAAGAGQGAGGWIITANLDHMLRFSKDASYRQMCSQASLVVADGVPILWAAKLQRTPLPGLIAGSNLISSLSCAAGCNGMSVFLLGGNPGTAERAGEVLRQQCPKLQIAGTYCPPFGFEKDPEEMATIQATLTAANPGIVFVALGSPKQELLIAKLREAFPCVWWVGIGISFSYLCGEVWRAPKWMQRSGLEWLHRMLQEPRRLSRRYLLNNLPYALRLLGSSMIRGIKGKSTRSARE